MRRLFRPRKRERQLRRRIALEKVVRQRIIRRKTGRRRIMRRLQRRPTAHLFRRTRAIRQSRRTRMRPTRTRLGRITRRRMLLVRMKVMRQNPLRMRKRLRDPRLLVPQVNRGLRASRVPRLRLTRVLLNPRPERVLRSKLIALPLRSRKNQLHRRSKLHRPRRKALLRKKSTRDGRLYFSVESNGQCCCQHWLFFCKVFDAATFLPQARHWQGWLRVCTEVQFRSEQEIFFCYNFLHPP